jgi:hypothetical protein
VFGFLKRKKKIGCPNCYEQNIISFGLDYLESKFESTIKLDYSLGGATLYKCEKCETSFFIRENIYERVFSGQHELLQKWSENKMGCPSSLKNQIDLIGLTQNWDLTYILPCIAELNNGQEFDFTTLRFSTQPPLGSYFNNFKNIFFIDEIKSIRPSDSALSKDIRLACMTAEEKRMGFYPTVVKNNENIEAVINGISIFFNSNDIKGSDLKLANKEWNYKDNYVYDLNKEVKTLVIVKE